jgi:FkbM family methyltransferase
MTDVAGWGQVKELVRGAMSSAPGRSVIRWATLKSPLGHEHRRWVYLKVGKKVRWDAQRSFEHCEPGGVPVRFTLQGTVRELYWLGAFEIDALPYFVQYARTASCVLDVGSAEGVYALLAASVSPDAKVFAFEPGSRQLERLQRNIELNRPGPGDRVEVVDVALSDHDGDQLFFELPGGTSSLNPEFRRDTAARQVRVARGDSLVQSLVEGRRVDLVKIDTESTEPDVISGLRDTIAADRPAIFCEVLRGRTEDRLQQLVDELGYDTWWLGPAGPERSSRIEGRPTFVNWLFLPSGTAPLTAPDATPPAVR